LVVPNWAFVIHGGVLSEVDNTIYSWT